MTFLLFLCRVKQYLSNWQHLVYFGQTIQELITNLESNCNIALNWFNKNKTTVNRGMSYVIIVDERKQDDTYEILKIGSKKSKVLTQVKLLWIEIHNGLNFVPRLIFFFFFFCKSAASQLNPLIRLKCSYDLKERKGLMNSFVLSLIIALSHGCLQVSSP